MNDIPQRRCEMLRDAGVEERSSSQSPNARRRVRDARRAQSADRLAEKDIRREARHIVGHILPVIPLVTEPRETSEQSGVGDSVRPQRADEFDRTGFGNERIRGESQLASIHQFELRRQLSEAMWPRAQSLSRTREHGVEQASDEAKWGTVARQPASLVRGIRQPGPHACRFQRLREPHSVGHAVVDDRVEQGDGEIECGTFSEDVLASSLIVKQGEISERGAPPRDASQAIDIAAPSVLARDAIESMRVGEPRQLVFAEADTTILDVTDAVERLRDSIADAEPRRSSGAEAPPYP
jgi:hypothetical protein